jgi:transcriptional regulator with GAF, ATPase, and Fis domain
VAGETYVDDFLVHVFPGRSAAMESFRTTVQKMNRYCHLYKGGVGCVLLTGETGVGKNFTVQAISAHSQWLTLTDDQKVEEGYYRQGRIALPPTELVKRLLVKEHRENRTRTTVTQRLATVLGPQLTDDLAGSELFGHKKGAFTGAIEDHPGIFGDKSVDDIFLDEIGDLPSGIQAKLLQVVESRTFRPVGGRAGHEDSSEHRLFLATNQCLEELVKGRTFREDLYWRIQKHRIEVPPLRERRDTIVDLARSILESVNHEQRGPESICPGRPLDPEEQRYCILEKEAQGHEQPQWSNWVVRFEPEDVRWMQEYVWPGNIRELRQRLELFVYHNGHRRLTEVMPIYCRFSPQTGEPTTSIASDPQALVDRALDVYLQAVLDGREQPPGQPMRLLQRFDRMVKRAVSRFREEHLATGDEMQRLFPNARDWQTTLGKWRADVNDESGHRDG